MAGRQQPKTGGRKKGTQNKASAARERAIAASGLTPLDYMLSLLRDETNSTEVPLVIDPPARSTVPLGIGGGS